MAENQLSNAEIDAIEATQAAGEAAAGAGPGAFQWSIQHETYLRKGNRQWHKINTRFAPSASLRVFQDGALTFGVEAGEWLNGDTLVTKTAQASQALTDASTNYIYYDEAGGLQVNITGFPTPSVEPHIRLATILTAGATYAYGDITDKRSQNQTTVSGSPDAIFYEGEPVSYENNQVFA